MTFNRFIARVSDALCEIRRDARIVASAQASAWTQAPAIGRSAAPRAANKE